MRIRSQGLPEMVALFFSARWCKAHDRLSELNGEAINEETPAMRGRWAEVVRYETGLSGSPKSPLYLIRSCLRIAGTNSLVGWRSFACQGRMFSN